MSGNSSDPPSAPPNPPAGRRVWPGVVTSVLGLAVIAGLTFIAVTYLQQGAGSPKASQGAEIEARFHDDVVDALSSSNLVNERRSARSDHKIIAYAIAHCLGAADIPTMSKAMFSTLLLDLRPNGDHWWNGPGASLTKEVSTAKVNPLTGYEAAVLAMSDEVSRARLAAAGGADGFFPFMLWFGWASVIVSAVATALVTLKAAMSGDDHPNWSMAFGIAAVMFSTTATVLTGAKQFWDPTNAYMRNEAALLALRQLHTEIALTFVESWDAASCQPQEDFAPQYPIRFQRWRNMLISLESGTMSAPVIVAAQSANASQNGETGSDGRDRLVTRVATVPAKLAAPPADAAAVPK